MGARGGWTLHSRPPALCVVSVSGLLSGSKGQRGRLMRGRAAAVLLLLRLSSSSLVHMFHSSKFKNVADSAPVFASDLTARALRVCRACRTAAARSAGTGLVNLCLQ